MVTVGVGGSGPATATYAGAAVVGSDDPLGPPAPTCTPGSCDQETVVLTAPTGYETSHVITLSMTVSFTDATGANDLDLSILNAAGGAVATTDAVASGGTVAATNLTPGTYTIEVDGDTAATPQSYSGTVTASASVKVAQKTAPSAGLGFSRETVASPYDLGTEPNLAVDPDGTTVYSSPIFGTSTTISFLLRSTDEGRTFVQLGNEIPETGAGKPDQCDGGGDSDLVTDKFSGDLYMIDLGDADVPARVSHDKGQTFASNCIPNDVNADPTAAQGATYFPDRQWLSYDVKHQRTWFIYRDGVLAPPDPTGSIGGVDVATHAYGEYIKYSANATTAGTAGMSQVQFQSLCTQAGTASPCFSDVSIAGNAITDNSPTSPYYGTTYLAFQRTGAGVGVAAINPDSTTPVVETTVPGNHTQELFPTVAVDSAGTVYEAWVDGTTFQINFAASKDGGKTWNAVQVINAAPAATTIMPWIVAGSAGRVAVGFYGSPSTMNPTTNYGPWNGYVAESTDADSATPTFTQDQFTDRPNHIDPICLSGLGCTTDTSAAGDRELGDFFKVAIAPDGRLLFSIADGDDQLGTTVTGTGPAPSFAHVVRQTSGPSLYASIGTVAPQAVPTNTVTVAPHAVAVPPQMAVTGAAGADVPALSLTSDSLTYGADNKLHGTIQVKSLDLTAATSTPADPFTDYWLRWIYKDKVYWAGVEVDATGGVTYVGGQPDALNDGLSRKYADYPSTVTPVGTMDAATNTITLTMDPADFGSPTSASDTLYAVTGYVSTHLTPTPPADTNTTDLPIVIDSLPSFNTGPLATGTAPVVLPPGAVAPGAAAGPTRASGTTTGTGTGTGSLASTGGLALAPMALAAVLTGGFLRRRRPHRR